MLVRLWWKEGRALAPILMTLVVAAIGVQWFLLSYGGSEIRNGSLVPIAMSWAVLYAIVAGSASFAGERENRTLGLLDALPVGRGTLWLGKASFALVSSLALAVALRVLGVTGWRYESVYPPIVATEPFFAVLIVEATVWGLLWSAVAKSAINAGILALISTAMMLLTGWLQELDTPRDSWAGMDVRALVWRGTGMVVATAVSWLVMNREHRPRFSMWSVPRNQSARSTQPRPTAMSPPVLDHAPTPAFWSVVWQTWREGRAIWLQTLALGLVATSLGMIGAGAILSFTLISLTLVSQGSSLFGLETATGTRAFLDQQAVRPRTVWAGKMIPWMVGLMIFCGVVGSSLVGPGSPPANLARAEIDFSSTNQAIAPSYLILLCNMFAVAVLGGMIFQRRVTAAMISIIVAIGVIIPQAAWFAAGMLTGASLLCSPLVWLAASWFWAGDWLANRGVRRWVHLALLVVVPNAALFAAFAASRAWGISDIGPQFGDASFAVAPPDLGDQYREVARRVDEFLKLRLEQPDQDPSAPTDEAPGRYLASKQDELAELRAIAAQPGSVAAIDAPATLFVDQRTTNAQYARDLFVPLFALDAEARARQGDLTGAWDDLESVLRLSNQYATGARSIHDYEIALQMSHTGIAEAIEWSVRPGMTIDLIRSARARLRALGDTADPNHALRYEVLRVERSLDQPAERWADLFSSRKVFGANSPWLRIATAWVTAPPWERERTRRIMRRVEATALRNATRLDSHIEPFWYGDEPSETFGRITRLAADQPLLPTNEAIPRDAPLLLQVLDPFVQSQSVYLSELNHRRMLDLFLALRAWQLTHDGQAPATLDQLSELGDELPISPSRNMLYETLEPPNTGHRLSYTELRAYRDPTGGGVRWVGVYSYDLPEARKPFRPDLTPAPSP